MVTFRSMARRFELSNFLDRKLQQRLERRTVMRRADYAVVRCLLPVRLSAIRIAANCVTQFVEILPHRAQPNIMHQHSSPPN